MKRSIRLVVLLILSFCTICFVWSLQPLPALAGPPAPITFSLTQPDGVTTFQARAWGDEHLHGTETVDGYTVLQDPITNIWFYAEVDSTTDQLRLTNQVVGQDPPPASALGARPRPPIAPSVQDITAQGPINVSSVPTLVLLGQFTNRTSIGSTEAQWANTFFGPTNSIRDYYNEVSYGQFTITPAAETCGGTANDGITGWMNIGTNHPNDGGGPDITSAALQQADDCVNYANFAGGDNRITPDELLVMVIVAGYEESYTNAGTPITPTVWAHWRTANTPSLDGITSFAYGQFGEWHATTTDNPGHRATIGVMVHEMGHLLGWPDLYDTNDANGDSEGVGRWSVMGTGNWLGSPLLGDTPAHPSAWEKWYQGWLTPRYLTNNAINLSIPRVEDNRNNSVIQLLDNPNGVDWSYKEHSGSGEYFLIENRQQVGYDAQLPGCGLLIWHIDETRISTSAANADENRKLVDLEEADGLNDLDNEVNRGDRGDPFPGTSNKTTFDAYSNPNSRFYNGNLNNAAVVDISSGCANTKTATFLPAAIYVDANATGFEDGSITYPFNTVTEGVNAVPNGGVIRILPRTYPETVTINRAMQLRSTGSVVTIGTP
jgi:M6 family metalloprotease-like protein